MKSRAPSRWIDKLWRRAALEPSSIVSIGTTRPPERLCVFSQIISLILGKNPAVAIARSIICGLIRPLGASTVRKATPDRAEAAPRSTFLE